MTKRVFEYGIGFAEQCIEEYGRVVPVDTVASIPIDQVELMESEGVDSMKSIDFWSGFNSVARR